MTYEYIDTISNIENKDLPILYNNYFERSTIGDSYDIINSKIFTNYLFNEINMKFNKIEDNNIKQIIKKICIVLEKNINKYSNFEESIDLLSPLKINEIEETSILIEWIFKNYRIGFVIDKKIDESSWYFVSNKELNGMDISGDLNEKNIDQIVEVLLNVVMRNI